MRVRDESSESGKFKQDVRQGCVLSPDLFSLYSEIIMRNIKDLPGIKVGGYNFNNLRYADDTVLIAGNQKDLQRLVDIINEESVKMGLSLNAKKTETMIISKKNTHQNCSIKVNGTNLKQTDQFKYLGAQKTSEGNCTTDIN